MKTRYRIKTRFFRAPLIVLQVQDIRHGLDPLTLEAWATEYWRDAQPSDLNVEIRQ